MTTGLPPPPVATVPTTITSPPVGAAPATTSTVVSAKISVGVSPTRAAARSWVDARSSTVNGPVAGAAGSVSGEGESRRTGDPSGVKAMPGESVRAPPAAHRDPQAGADPAPAEDRPQVLDGEQGRCPRRG